MPASTKPPAKPAARAKPKTAARPTGKAPSKASAKTAAKPTTRPAKSRARPSAEPPVRTAAAPEKPFLRFYHSEGLRAKTLSLLNTLEQAQDSTRYRGALSDLVLELTESGFDYFFLKPLKLAQTGFVVEQSAQLGMSGVKRVMAPVVRNILGRMDQRQLRTVCAYIRRLME